jgi:flagellar biogenesis protein FliO
MEQVSLAASLVKMLSALALVLGLLVGSAFLLKKLMGRTVESGAAGAAITILATKYLGPKNAIVLVDIVGHVVAVGVSPQQITPLVELGGDEAREKLRSLGRGGTRPATTESMMRGADVLRDGAQLFRGLIARPGRGKK